MSEPKVLLLDGIQDPGNLGSILRSMVAFDIKTLCVTDDCVDVFHPKAVNASSGALAHIAVYHQKHWEDWIKVTKIPKIVLDPEAAFRVSDIKKKDDFILICGSEGRGIQNSLITSVQLTPVCIPMGENMESLNVAVSAGIALHHLIRV